MALDPGTRLGLYEITGRIGAGGMGEVYRATDTKLGRAVAIKTLPAALATDPDRLARFEREAKLLAALNHPHIAAVYGLDEHEGTLYLAMELVEGETLEKRLERGALPMEQALRLALQIAEALESAHDKGVVHRDLKPANVMVTGDGQVKVLDFGLAKAFSGDPHEASPGHSPALSLAMTQQGIILGTASYMSPEQASGQATDARADVWAFGVVLYEMLTGLPLYRGESVPHILAAVLQLEPDWSKLPKDLHPRLRQTLERCLTKRPRNRYAGIADARVDIEEALQNPGAATSAVETSAVAPARGRGLVYAVVAAALLIGGVVGAFAMRLSAPAPERPITALSFQLPAGHTFRRQGRNVMAFSPDGRRLLYNAIEGLYLREMAELQPRLIAGTEEDLANPIISPDGQTVAYFSVADSALKRISIHGGAPIVVASGITMPVGASWAPDDTILFSQGPAGVFRVSANGGVPERVIPPTDDLAIFGRPELLPGGNAILVAATTAGDGPGFDKAQIVAYDLETQSATVLVSPGSDPRYLSSGHLVYALGQSLFAMVFDVGTLTVSGGAVPLVQGARRSGATDSANYDISAGGALAYLAGGSVTDARLAWVAMDGKEELIPIEPANYSFPRLAPDGRRVAVDEGSNIWVWDFESQTRTRLNTGEGGGNPVWTSDGARIAYTDAGARSIRWRAANNTGPIDVLLESKDLAGFLVPEFFAEGDTELVFTASTGRGFDVAMVPTSGDGEPVWLLDGPYDEYNAALSPDGHWLAYVSQESGRAEIYVRPFPDVDADQIQVSNTGGEKPVWSRDGNRLFYLGSDQTRLMQVTVDATETRFGFRDRKAVVTWPWRGQGFASRTYDVAPDNEHLLTITLETGNEAEFVVIENWRDELERQLPTH